jgi:hypothetical protein
MDATLYGFMGLRPTDDDTDDTQTSGNFKGWY